MQDRHNSGKFYDLYRDPMTGNCDPRGYTYVAGYGFAPPPRADYERRIIRSYSTGIALMLLFFLLASGPIYNLIFSLEMLLFGGGMGYGSYTAASQIANMGAYTIALVLPALIYCRRIRIPIYNAFPLEGPNNTGVALAAVPVTLMTVVVGAYTASVMGVFFAVFGMYPTSPVESVPTDTVGFMLYFISTAILPAIVEELMFRGAILQSLRRFGDTFALFVSSLLFGLTHGNLIQAPMAFLTGLAIGYFVLRTGSLRTGMFIHFVNNALAVVLSAVGNSLSYDASALLTNGVYALYIIAGLIALAFLLKHYGNMFQLHRSNTVMTMRGKLFSFFSTGSMVVLLILMAVTTSRYFLII
ncbi:MAG: CPBP family intramembrane metalloprotease [Clostridiales bacterium]|nr:CPBP family intramembrane metalloprotease [Clostridiales bacterium]